jgi:hypothetical protein
MGGRTVELFIPFEHGGKKIEKITFSPLLLGHVLRWNEGAWKTMIGLLVELADVDETVVRGLRYPDADRIMETFLGMLTPEIRDDIGNNRIPTPFNADEDVEAAMRAVAAGQTANGGDDGQGLDPSLMRGPGVPLPEAGFDLSEEP